MKKVFIVHGFNGTPNGAWKSWLMNELAKNGLYACALPMPTPDYPIKEEWIKTIKDAVGIPNEEIFLVGHSLGVPAILRYLETLDKEFKIGGAVLVSGPVFKIERDGYEQVNSFINNSFDFDYIKKRCGKFIVIHGIDDKWVPITNAEYLSNKLSCNLITVPNGGHFSSGENCFQLPEVLDSLLKMMKSSH